MENLNYLTKKETYEGKQYFYKRIKKIIQQLSDQFSLSYQLVGSSKRNLVLVSDDNKFDFDYQIIIHKFKNMEKDALKIKNIFIQKLTNHFLDWKIENSTTAITLKNNNLNYSFDVVICAGVAKKEFEILRRENNNYVWNILKEYKNHQENLKLIKQKQLWTFVKDAYKLKKMKRKNEKSYLLFMEVVKETVDLQK